MCIIFIYLLFFIIIIIIITEESQQHIKLNYNSILIILIKKNNIHLIDKKNYIDTQLRVLNVVIFIVVYLSIIDD